MAIKVSGPAAHQRTGDPTTTFLARRVLAGLVDLGLASVPVALIIVRSGPGGLLEKLDFLLLLAAFTGIVVVGLIVPTLTGGRTPGKLLFGLSLSLEGGGRPSIRHHALRTAAAIADLMPGVVPGLTGFAVAASSPRRQRLGDRLAGTTVIDLTNPPSETNTNIHLNQELELADNANIRPVFSLPEPSSEVFNMSSADDNADQSIDQDIEIFDQALETDDPSDEADDSDDVDWVDGTVSTFTVAEVVEEDVEEHAEPVEEVPTDESIDFDTVDEPADEAEDAVAIIEPEVAAAEPKDPAAIVEPADTHKSRLVATSKTEIESASTTYPLPSHRQTSSGINEVISTEAAVGEIEDAEELRTTGPGVTETPAVEADGAANADEEAAKPQVEIAEQQEAEQAKAEEPEDDLVAQADEVVHSGEDPTAPVWSEDWNAWICWNDGEQAWLRYDSAIGEWLSMEAETAER